jgi:DNA-binding transcriptional ArsR family regulator
MTFHSNRNFLGVWLPKEVYLDKNLSWTEKILYVEIQSLDNENGCFASNEYFAEFLDVSTTTISLSISKLKKLGYVECVSFDGRKRILKSAFKTGEKQHLRKLKGRVKENLKHNNTDNNSIKLSLKWEDEIMSLDYPKEMKIDFIEYWQEKTPKGKTRQSLEKTWCSKRRMKTWSRNDKKWNSVKTKKSIDNSISSYMKAKQKLMES